MEEKQDLRIKKTQRALALSLLTLLEGTNFQKITVNDLCTQAMVSRSAFYSHFEDKYALLGFCMEVLQQRMFEESEHLGTLDRLRSILEKTRDNVKIFRNLIMSQLDMGLIDMMRQAFHRDFARILNEHDINDSALPKPLEVVTVYYASALTSAILFWVNKGMPYSLDEMANCLHQLLPAELRS